MGILRLLVWAGLLIIGGVLLAGFEVFGYLVMEAILGLVIAEIVIARYPRVLFYLILMMVINLIFNFGVIGCFSFIMKIALLVVVATKPLLSE